jgi:hypothetical protein
VSVSAISALPAGKQDKLAAMPTRRAGILLSIRPHFPTWNRLSSAECDLDRCEWREDRCSRSNFALFDVWYFHHKVIQRLIGVGRLARLVRIPERSREPQSVK